MADEFIQAGICGGNNWWNPTRSLFGSSPCSLVFNDMASFGWPPPDLVDFNTEVPTTRSSTSTTDDSSNGSVLFQDIQKPLDSTLQMMDCIVGLSPSTTSDWNNPSTLLCGDSGRDETNYNAVLPEILNSVENFCTGGEDSSISDVFPLDQQDHLIGTPTCQATDTSFPMTSSGSYNCSSFPLLENLFDQDSQPQHQSMFESQLPAMDYPSSTSNYRAKLNELSAPLPKFGSSMLPKQQLASHLHFSNKTPFWNASSSALSDIQASFFPPTQPQFLSTFEEKPNCRSLIAKRNINEEVQDSGSLLKKNSITEPAFKRSRIETPLPTFKVRKEKLGDRITALQQLVSPFGKTDTASVLHEAIEYIKLLHDQVNVLSTPYMKNGTTIQRHQASDSFKDAEGPKQDLRSRGLCLVPISSTFPVTAETTADFWTPTFRGAFR